MFLCSTLSLYGVSFSLLCTIFCSFIIFFSSNEKTISIFPSFFALPSFHFFITTYILFYCCDCKSSNNFPSRWKIDFLFGFVNSIISIRLPATRTRAEPKTTRNKTKHPPAPRRLWSSFVETLAGWMLPQPQTWFLLILAGWLTGCRVES